MLLKSCTSVREEAVSVSKNSAQPGAPLQSAWESSSGPRAAAAEGAAFVLPHARARLRLRDQATTLFSLRE